MDAPFHGLIHLLRYEGMGSPQIINPQLLYPSNWKSRYLYNHDFLSKGQWTYGPTLCLLIDTHIRSKFNRVVYFFVCFQKI